MGDGPVLLFVGRIQPLKGADLAVRALVNFKRLVRVRRVERLRAVATSAVREARNRSEFIRRIKRETGITVEVISGLDEARLIFKAARHALGLMAKPMVVTLPCVLLLLLFF